MSEKPPENKNCCVFVTLGQALYLQREGVVCHGVHFAPPRFYSSPEQTNSKSTDRAPVVLFASFVATVGSPAHLEREGWSEGVFSWMQSVTSPQDAYTRPLRGTNKHNAVSGDLFGVFSAAAQLTDAEFSKTENTQ